MDSSSSRTRIPLSFHVDRVAKRIAQLAPKLRSEGSLGGKKGRKEGRKECSSGILLGE